MNLETLIQEYKTLSRFCYNVDYTNKKARKKNNEAVSRMYEIVEAISEFGEAGTENFKELLDIEEFETGKWAAVHLLERLNPSRELEMQALKTVERFAGKTFEYKFWLQDYYSKKGNNF